MKLQNSDFNHPKSDEAVFVTCVWKCLDIVDMLLTVVFSRSHQSLDRRRHRSRDRGGGDDGSSRKRRHRSTSREDSPDRHRTDRHRHKHHKHKHHKHSRRHGDRDRDHDDGRHDTRKDDNRDNRDRDNSSHKSDGSTGVNNEENSFKMNRKEDLLAAVKKEDDTEKDSS